IATVSSRKIEVDESLCIRCGQCSTVCGTEAIEEGNHQLTACIHCCRCVDVCPTRAVTLLDKWKPAVCSTRAVTLADKWKPAGGKNS
ncbi:MAG: 4Fe-4S binding protein, partial [bacterium]|nr:4Fe-4S binding protein [bacterium]